MQLIVKSISLREANGGLSQANISREVLFDEAHPLQLVRRFNTDGLATGWWQERIFNGDWHNIVDADRVAKLEAAYATRETNNKTHIKDW